MNHKLSVVLPAKNEADNLSVLLPEIKRTVPEAEIIVVDDGSTDHTERVCIECEVSVIKHPYSKGNGAAIKSGARAASGDVIIFMDADGQHQAKDILKLVDEVDRGYDMVVGARDNDGHANTGRLMANVLYNKMASWMVECSIPDLTSGFRAVRAQLFSEFLHLLPNGFSYPTTSTMAFFRAGYSVKFLAIDVKDRVGKSHIRPLKDGMKFLLIIFKIGTLYSPLKLFTSVSLVFFSLGLVRYIYSYMIAGEFTNMSALLFSVAVLIFMIGLVSEQITALQYQRVTNKKPSIND